MRVSTKALAPLSALLFFASCVTPPPLPRSDRDVAYDDGGYSNGYRRERRSQDEYRDDRYLGESRYEQERRYNEERRIADERAYRDDRRDRVEAVPAGYGYKPEPEPEAWSESRADYDQRGRYDRGYDGRQDDYYDGYDDQVPPHERGNYSNPPGGRISFLLGRRNMNDMQFEPVDEPVAFGVEFAQATEPGTLGFEFGFSFGRDNQDNVSLAGLGITDVEVDMAEIYAGVRTEFGRSNIRPYIGGGGTLLNMTETRTQGFGQAEDDDSVLGGYIHGGVQIDVSDAVYLGVDYRRVFGSEFELFNRDLDSDYSQLSVMFGISL